MYASVSIIVNKILIYYLLDTRTFLWFMALQELMGTHNRRTYMYGWLFIILLSNSCRYTRADVVIYENGKLAFLAFANIMPLSLKTKFVSPQNVTAIETLIPFFIFLRDILNEL